jgi:hypothetical protein
VLVVYGTSDPTTSADESRYLVDMINEFRPGRATYLQIEGMSHPFDRQPTQADALRALRSGKDGEFDPAFLSQIESWINNLVSALNGRPAFLQTLWLSAGGSSPSARARPTMMTVSMRPGPNSVVMKRAFPTGAVRGSKTGCSEPLCAA